MSFSMKALVCIILTGTILGGGTLRAMAKTIAQSVGISSSPNPVGSGARAMGMGGAFIAVADDATAASWNPAALIQLEKPEISMVGEYVYRTNDFSSFFHPESNNSVSSSDANINYLSLAFPFSRLNKNMVVSLNYQRLYDFKRSLDYSLELTAPSTLPDISSLEQRKYSQDGHIGAFGLAYAVDLTHNFSLGLTLNLWTDKLFGQNGWDETYSNHSMTVFNGISTIEDTLKVDQYTGFEGINFNLGFFWNLNQYLTVGGVLKTPFTADLDHSYIEEWTQKDQHGNILQDVRLSDSEQNELEMPLSYGLGVAARFNDVFSLSFDVYHTLWQDYNLIDGQGNEFSPIDSRPTSLSNVKNTVQVRFGAEYLFLDPGKKWAVPLRGGIFYDPEPAQGTVNDFYGLSIGSGISCKQFSLDIAYQFRWGNDIETANLIATSQADMSQHQLLLSLIHYY